MAVFYCHSCGNYIDNDYHPGEDIDGELVCPSCVEGLPEKENKPPLNITFTAAQQAFINKMEQESEEWGE